MKELKSSFFRMKRVICHFQHKIDCVIHFAAIKAVGESMQVPLHYYRNNIIGAINLLEVRRLYYTRALFWTFLQFDASFYLQVMKAAGCFQLVFSSSCTVYGEPTELPITEKHETGNITNVYGRTKYFIEEMLKDISRAEKVYKEHRIYTKQLQLIYSVSYLYD